MEQIGKVVDVQGSTLTIIIKRSSMCGENCASCGACAQKNFKITCENTIGAELHDSVILETADSFVLRSAFLVYILPVFLMVAAYLALDKILLNKAFVILCSFAVLALFFLILHRIDRLLSHKPGKWMKLIKISDRSM